MSTDIIVMGAAGRMGTTIGNTVQADPDCSLVGVTERQDCAKLLDAWDTDCGTDLAAICGNHPGAAVICFTAPAPSVEAARICAESGNSLVIGTTGINPDQMAEITKCAADAPMLFAPNMSLGINVLLKVLPRLVQLLGETYDMEMVELHHKMKKDAPSGTALILARCLAEARGWDLDEVGNYERHGIIGERPQQEIGVQTIRGGDVVGVHTCYFMGPGERIQITHQAHSREMFAMGAVRAAKWLASAKPGKLHTMADVLD